MPEGPGGQGPNNPYPSGPQTPPPGGYPPPPAPGGYPPAGPGNYPPQGPGGYSTPPPGPASWGAPPPPAKKRSPLAIIIVVGLLLFLGAVVAYTLLSGKGNVTELQVGQCFDEPANTSSVTDVQHQDCTKAHDAEVFFIIKDTSTTYPGVVQFRAEANDQCPTQASAYLGADFDSRTDLSAGFFYPSSDSWDSGDHDVTCYLDKGDGGKLYQSLKGIGTAPLATAPPQ